MTRARSLVLSLAVVSLTACGGEPFPPPPQEGGEVGRAREEAREQSERALEREVRREQAAERREQAMRRRTERRERAQRSDESEDGNCDAAYDPCVPRYPPDVNCADVDGTVELTGDADPHKLDRDGDGRACEPQAE